MHLSLCNEDYLKIRPSLESWIDSKADVKQLENVEARMDAADSKTFILLSRK